MAAADRTSPALREGNRLVRLFCAVFGHRWGAPYAKPCAGMTRWTRECERCGREARQR